MSKRYVRLGIVGGTVLVMMVFHQHLIAGWIKLTGRSPYCRFDQVTESIAVTLQHADGIKKVSESSRMVESDPAGYELWETPLGRFWVPQGSSKEIFYDISEQLRDIYNFNGLGVKAGDIVFDNGANIGLYTRVALNAGAKKVIAVEPAPENLECLRRNFKDEMAGGSVVLYPKGVWDKDDWLTLYVNPTNSAGDSFVRQTSGSKPLEKKLPLTTIDKIVEELQLERVDYMKFDIEGAERNALAGARKTLERHHPRMAVSVYHLPDDPVVIPQAVKAGWPNYRQECGKCVTAGKRVYPEVFFYF